MEQAIFAAGCFWAIEAEFSTIPGVTATRVGYTGGRTEHPTYQDVCTNLTGHAEAVEVTFDPGIVSYSALLDIFWECHDPTQLNRQGPDIGEQYRSAIFYLNQDQQQEAEASRDRLDASGRLRRSIVTQIAPATTFWEAEAYHQHYQQIHSGGCGF